MSFFITESKEIPSILSTENGLVCLMLGQLGLLVYEYNPLKVFRINKDTYLKDNSGNYILYENLYIPIILEYVENDIYKIPLEDGEYTNINLKNYTKYTFYPKNSILDLDTEDLTFNLTHPVNIEIQPSYDGSVNLLLVDGLHDPMLINSRFSCTGGNTYQIVDRSGDNDTNIYDLNTFDVETSLYKKITKIPKLDFLGISLGGNLKVGNYVFYFKLVDADGNETDIVAESGIVSCYIGNINDPKSQRGGLEDENSYKVVNFTLSNIDQAYSYVNVYFTRSTGVREGDEYTTAHKVLNLFYINNGRATINITGFEHTMESSIEDLNVRYDIVETAKTLIQCLNMLFLGNIQFPVLDTKELLDLSLRICPHLYVEDSIGRVDENYEDPSGGYEYYNALNIYNKLGYWDDEIYRFGIVYILNDLSLSPVFNIRGCLNLTNSFEYEEYDLYINGLRNYIIIDKETNLLSNNENVKGVVKINNTKPLITNDGTYPIGLTFKIPKDVVSELKKHTKGFFFVRLPRLKTTFCLAITVGKELESNTPILKSEDGYFAERFINDDRILTHNFELRLQHVDDGYILKGGAALCPEYELNLAFYNLFFTSSEFTIREAKFNFANLILNKKDRYFYNIEYSDKPSSLLDYSCTITSVPDNTKAVKGKYSWFSARAGEAEDATMFANIGYRNKLSKATNLLRGSYGSYLGLEGLASIDMTLVDIKIPAYNEASMHEYFKIRFRDKSEFKAVSDRYSWDDLVKEDENYLKIDGIYRGDCYICNFTHRMNRNFQDPETPTIDEFVDGNTWKDNYSTGKNDSEEKRLLINRSDVNAVKIGHWVTFKIKSSTNLSLRCINPFYITEYGMTGLPRSFYPLLGMDPSGNAKLPESDLMSAGFNVNLPSRIYFEIADTPSDLSKYLTRIMFSDISVLNGYKNGYRTFRTQNHRDYSLLYGQLIRMMEWSGNIFAIFEHGVALIAVNERALAAKGTGGSAFINTLLVLPENPVILSDSFGSLWHDSIVQTPYAIYGVDTVAKKIWKIYIKGSLQKLFVLDVISDFKVQKFLNDNISLTEHELTPIIGIRNVKTHYNANKNDVMFTFYDDINTILEKVWNLCYNEVLDKFITFYSWIPSFSENIDNIFFSFDRETSKNVAKLYCDLSDIQIDSGPIINYTLGDSTLIGKLSIPILDLYYIILNTGNTNLEYKKPSIKFEIADERLLGRFWINNSGELHATSTEIIDNAVSTDTLWKIPIKATMNLYVQNMQDRDKGIIESVMYNTITKASLLFLDSQEDTYFWKHGQAGLTKTKDKIKPTHWYGKQHPFEFEFMVANNPASHKIFTDLCIIANKAEPESLHFEITGEVYKFADDKKNMFFRQEAIKHLYLYKGADVLYDSRYLDMIPEQRDIPYSTSLYKDKSTMFPMYYSRVDTINDIEDYYQSKCVSSKDYQKLSGSEIIYDETLNEFKIATHIKACPFGKLYKLEISAEEFLRNKHYSNFIKENGRYYKIDTYGRLNGNISYNEDLWYAQIPSIIYWEKNEKEWTVRDSDGNKYPPLNVANNPVPEGINNLTISNDLDIPKDLRDKGYKLDNYGSFDTSIWENRKETRLRDRFLKVRIRYTGNDLAVIYAIRTLYTISYV